MFDLTGKVILHTKYLSTPRIENDNVKLTERKISLVWMHQLMSGRNIGILVVLVKYWYPRNVYSNRKKKEAYRE
jgi:hypothetical protein